MTPRPGGPETGPARLGSAVVIGTGLIGTSIALALREQGVTVWLTDHDPAAARLAADLGAGEVLPEPLGAAVRGRGSPETGGVTGTAAAGAGWAVGRSGGAGRPTRCRGALARGRPGPPPGPLVHRRRQREGTPAAPGQRAGLRPGLLRARPPAVRAGEVGSRRRPGRPVPRPPMGDMPGPQTAPEAIAAVADLVRCCRGELVQADAARARPLGGAGLARAAPGRRGHGGPADRRPRRGARPRGPGTARRDQDRRG